MVSFGEPHSLYSIGDLPNGFHLDRFSRQRTVAVGPEERCIWNKDHEENFRSSEQTASLFTRKGQEAAETKELNPWAGFLQ